MVQGYTDKNHIYNLYKLMYKVGLVLERYGIVYMASGGTLLGAIRHKGIIPWDDDVDIQIDRSFVPLLTSKMVRESFKGYNLVLKKHPEGWYKVREKERGNKADLDIFISKFAKVDGEDCIVLDGNAGKIWSKCYFKVKDVYPLKKLKFGKQYIYGPANSNPYLDLCYGKSWKKVGYITLDADHYELDEPIKVPVKKFTAAHYFYAPLHSSLTR